MRALLIAAATLVATGANADDPQGQPTGAEKAAEKAADKAGKAMDKAEKAADKAADKAEKTAEKAADKAEKTADTAAKAVEDRAARRAKEHDAQREKLSTAWKGPISDALRQELRRHAERLARLERIKAIAETQKDKESVEKATKLFAKENERHEKWLSSNVPVLGATPATTPTPAAENGKEGAR